MPAPSLAEFLTCERLTTLMYAVLESEGEASQGRLGYADST